jgi:hypothetical protein
MQAAATWAEKLRIVLSNLVASALNGLSFANPFPMALRALNQRNVITLENAE